MSLGSYLEKYSFEYLLEQALNRVPNTIDKREGSIIYDAVAPACYALAEMYLELKAVIDNTFITTMYGDFLDARVLEQGLTRYQATSAKKKGEFTFVAGTTKTIPIGSRLSTVNEDLSYIVTEAYRDEHGLVIEGEYVLECETVGTVGNGYTGQILPITYLSNIESARMTTLLEPADDIETDDSLRQRYLDRVSSKAFGGNVAQYKEEAQKINGIGLVQIYPVWDGGGTVKLSILDSEYNVATKEFINSVQEQFDPSSLAMGLGIAPIGHKVTVVTPDELELTVNATLTIKQGASLTNLKPEIENSINAYLLEVRKAWDTSDDLNNYSLTVYLSQIMVRILQVPGVLNVRDCMINNSNADVILQQNATTQQVPKLKEVVLA